MNSNDEKDGGIGDVLRWLRLKPEDDLYDYGVSLVNHFNETWKLAILWITVLSLLTITYIFAAAYEFNNHSSAGTHSDLYNVIYVVSVIILMLATAMLTLTSARVGIYSAAMMLFEGIALTIVDGMYAVVSALTPDLLENALDKNKVLEKKIKNAVEKKELSKLAKDIIRGYLSAMAWSLFIPWLVLALPLAVFENPTVVFMSIIAIALLIYMVLAWSEDEFWYPLMKEGAKYAAAGYIIIYLVVVPIAKQTGIFEGFGPASAGYLRTGFWFVLFVTILAILSTGFKYQKDEKDGKRKLELSPFPIGIAVVILLAGLIFGNLALTKAQEVPSPFSNFRLGNGNSESNSVVRNLGTNGETSKPCKVVSSGKIPVNVPFSSIGSYQGNLVIEIDGKATIDPTMGDMGPEGLPNQLAANFFSLPNAPIYSAIGKVAGKKVHFGNKKVLNLSSPTSIEIGPNDEPGLNGAGFKDNGGYWTYKVCKS